MIYGLNRYDACALILWAIPFWFSVYIKSGWMFFVTLILCAYLYYIRSSASLPSSDETGDKT